MLNRLTLAGLSVLASIIPFATAAQEVTSSVDISFKPTCVEAVLSANEVRPGGRVAVTFRFRNDGMGTARADYMVFTHVEFTEKDCSDIVVHADHRPTVPATCWRPGEVVSDGAHVLQFPAEALEGTYHIHVGVYDPDDPSAPRISDQYVAQIEVSRDAPEMRATPPAMSEVEAASRRSALAGRVGNPAVLQDERVAFRISRQTGVWELADKKTGETWHSSPERESFGTIRLSDGTRSVTEIIDSFSSVRRHGQNLLLTYRPKVGGGSVKVLFTIELLPERGLRFDYSEIRDPAPAPEGGKWRVEIVRMLDNCLWVTDTERGYFAVPERLGVLLAVSQGLPDTKRYTAYSNHRSYSMAMVGIVKNDSALLVHWDDPYTHLEARRSWPDIPIVPGHGMLSASLELSKSSRSFIINPLGKGGYAEIASAYREVARERGLLRTWREKANADQRVDAMLGAANFKPFVFVRWLPNTRLNDTDRERILIDYTFDEAAQIAEHLRHDLGIERAMFVLAGWIRRGYDNQHPDILPAAPECGGDEGLADCSRRVKALGYLFGLHDNYQDMYTDAPSWDESFIMKSIDGSLCRGGEWSGGLAYVTCSKKALELAKRDQNFPSVKKLFAPSIYFIDTTFAAPLFECFDPEDPLSALDDIHWKRELSEYARETFGLFGSEEGQEWAVPCADYFEGLMSHKTERANGDVVIPLFPMVYGDCINLYTHQGDRAVPDRPDYVLDHLLYAEMPIYQLGPHLYYRGEDERSVPVRVSVHSVKSTGPRRFEIVYAWEASATPKSDHAVFVHFVNPDLYQGEGIAFQNDHGLTRSMTDWRPGEKVLDGPYTVHAPEDGVFDVMVGLLDSSAQRVPMLGEESQGIRYRLGTLTVSSAEVSFVAASVAMDPRLCFARNEGQYASANQTDRFIKNTYEILSPLNRLTAHSPMTSHQFLRPDRKVERSRFGDAEITVNHGDQPFCMENAVLPQYGFVVQSPLLVAFYATEYAGNKLSQPTLLVVESLDGKPLAESASVRKHRAFGDCSVTIAGRVFDFSADDSYAND